MNNLFTFISNNLELDELDTKGFGSIKLNGMKYTTHSYYAKGIGHVSRMVVSGMLGLMKMETIVINPFEVDAPLFSYDRIEMPGKITLIEELYNTTIENVFDDKGFIELLRNFTCLADRESKPQWYDDIRYNVSLSKTGKKADKQKIDELETKYLELYLETLRTSKVCDKDAKMAKAKSYSDGLLDNGGPATDLFLKAYGKEKTTNFFRNVVFGA